MVRSSSSNGGNLAVRYSSHERPGLYLFRVPRSAPVSLGRIIALHWRMTLSQRVVYVGGLTDTTSDYELRDLLAAYGTVTSAYVVRHKHSGKSAGYGFVERGSDEQALRAVVALEGALFRDNCLRIFVMPDISPHR